MKTNMGLYFFAPIAAGWGPGFLVYFLSDGALFAEASLLAALVAAAIRHRAHKLARRKGTTPFSLSTEVERGYMGYAAIVNTYFMRGNLTSACIIVFIYIVNLVGIVSSSTSGGCSTFLGLFSWIVIENALCLKGVPISEQGPPVPYEPELPKIVNMSIYEQTGMIVSLYD